jgi:hypothetical protein
MPLWLPPPVGCAPEVVLVRWMLIRTERHEVHAVGYNVDDREGRVSSPIVRFDRRRRLATTRSGRIYRLDGEAGTDSDARYVFDAWRRINGVTRWSEVTEDVFVRRPAGPAAGHAAARARRRRTSS